MKDVSQVSAVNAPQPKSWTDYEDGCIRTFHGGYEESDDIAIFQHGIGTVFNLLRAEFPPTELCKVAPDLLEALNDLYQYTEIYGGGLLIDELRRKAERAIKKAEA